MAGYNYILNSPSESERLESQSQLPLYDFRSELKGIRVGNGFQILDAGCGTGLITRHLAAQFPQAQLFGCDMSEERLEFARQKSLSLGNTSFSREDLSALNYSNHYFDLVICRYVIQHIPVIVRATVFEELFRCLKPGGQIRIVDFDGTFLNLFPRSTFVDGVLERLKTECPIDLTVGRKIKSLLTNVGFVEINQQVEAMNFTGPDLDAEIKLTEQRITHAGSYLKNLLGTIEAVEQFKREMLEALSVEGATYFYNKFIFTARKPVTLKIIN